jgi:hypothetical protein
LKGEVEDEVPGGGVGFINRVFGVIEDPTKGSEGIVRDVGESEGIGGSVSSGVIVVGSWAMDA